MERSSSTSAEVDTILTEAFNFNAWKKLHQEDPAEFEAKRENLLNSFIESAPPRQQRRLRGIKFRIDMIRRRSTNPLQACIEISEMMWESLNELNNCFNELEAKLYMRDPIEKTTPQTAKVLSFIRS